MATDLRQKQGTTVRPEPVRPGPPEPGTRWLFVATGIVLVVIAAVAALVFTQGRSQPGFGRDHWAANVEGMMTDVREGSREAPEAAAEPITHPHGLENPGTYVSTGDRGAYAQGALTGNREGSGYQPVEPTDPRPPLGSTRYADGALTEISEGP
jgi:hypothetical protein